MTATENDTVPHIVRVSISIPGLNIDIPLPANIPVDLIISDLIPFLRDILCQRGNSTTWIDQIARWKLSTEFGQRLSPTKTLNESGVVHGDLLLIEIEKTAEQFTPLIDDIADAIATIQAQNFPDFTPAHMVTIISYTWVVIAAILALFIGPYAQSHRIGINYWFPSGLIFCGALPLISAWIIEKKYMHSEDSKPYKTLVPCSLILGSLFWIGTGVLIIVPRPLGAAQILSTAMVISALVITSGRITLNHPLMHGTILILCIIFSAISAQQIIIPQDNGVLGAEMILFGIMTVFFSTKISLISAQISLPPIPSPGQAHLKDDAIIAIGDMIQSTDSHHDGLLPKLASEEEKRAIRQYLINNSLLLGAVIVISTGAFFAVQINTSNFWYIICFLLINSAILIFRGKSYSDLINRSILYIGAISTCCAAWIHLILQDHNPIHIIYYTAPSLGVFFLFYIGIIQGRTLDKPISRQRMEIIERILYASIFPLITIITGLYSQARYHS